MKKSVFSRLLCVLLLACMVFACTACGGGSDSKADTKVIDMSLEDAKAKVTEAGATPVVADVYDESQADGALLSLGDFPGDAKSGDYVTILRNDLGIKDDVKACAVAPAIIEKSSYEDKIYSKVSSDSALKRKFDSYYMLIESGKATDAQKRAYPIVEDMDIYVLDSAVTAKERSKIEGYIKENTEYTADDMFNDYVKVGIVSTPSDMMKAAVVSADELEFEESGDGVAVTAYKGKLQNIVVPAVLDGKPVVTLSKGAFPQSTIHAVTLQDGIKTLATGAFSAAYGVLNIYLPDSVSSFEENAFPVALLTKTSDDGFTTLGSEGDIVLYYNGDAAEVTVPDGIRFIGGGFARDNKTMTSVALPDGLLSIGVEAFRECEVLTTYNIPATVTKICDGAFRTTRHLTDITIPASVTEIGEYAFFETNDVLQITIGENVKTIGYEAFDYNMIVTEINIPDSVEYIGGNAFLKCRALATVTGGKNVTYVGGSAFDEDPWYTNLCISDGAEFAYLNSDNKILVKYGGTSNDVTIPDGVICLSSAFKDNPRIKSVVINDGCKSIAENAFGTCTALTDITIPASVTDIHEKAFTNIEQKITIHCEAGSAAETFAKDHHLKSDNKLG